MRVNNNLSVLPFYQNPEWQKHNLPYSFGGFFPLVTDSNKILPFQIIRDTRAAEVTSVKLINRAGIVIEEMLTKMEETGLAIHRFESKGFDIILYPSKFIFGSRYEEGFHYLEITDGIDTWYSEFFVFVNDTSGYLRIDWWNTTNLEMDNGAVLYRHPDYMNYMYLFSEVAMPEYIYEEEGDTRDGEFYPEKQLSWKNYKFTFPATEPMLDVLRLIPMADSITIKNRSREYQARSMLITPEEWRTGDISIVEAEFKTDTIVKKMGGMFNNDFNCCGGGNGPDPGACTIPVSVNILGNGTPVSGSTEQYVLQKTGGTGIHQVQWAVSGGVINGSSTGNTVSITWGAAGNRELFVEVTCDGSSYVNNTREIVVSESCIVPSSIIISGDNTIVVNSTKSYTFSKVGGSPNNTILWSVTGDAQIIGANNAQTVVIQAGNTEGQISVNVAVGCPGQTAVTGSFPVVVSSSGQPCETPDSIYINGPLSVTIGSTVTYNALKLGGTPNNTYFWNVMNGTINGAANEQLISVTWNTLGSGSVNVSVGCAGGSSIQKTESVTISNSSGCTPPDTVEIWGPDEVIEGQIVQYQAITSNGNNFMYDWSIVSGGASIIGPDYEEFVNIQFNDANVSPKLRVEVGCPGDMRWDEKDVEVNEAQQGVLFRLPAHPLPSGNNTTDWSGFTAFTPPQRVKNIGGDGFGLWANEAVNGAGKLTLFDIGFTNLFNLSAFERSKWGPANIYIWSVMYYMFNQAVRACADSGRTGVVNGVDYGDMNAVTSPGDLRKENIPYYHLTIDGMKEVGKEMNWGTMDSVDDPGNWNISGDYAVLMIDEESMTDYSWAGGQLVDAMGYITAGIMDIAQWGDKHVFWYGHPISWEFNQMRFKRDSNGIIPDSDINDLFKPANMNFQGGAFNGIRWYLDRMGGYFKMPWLSEVELYKKDGSGNFIIVNGKRVFRDTDFTVTIYGQSVTIYAQPHDWIKWNGFKPGDERFFGWQAEWGPYDSVEMTFNLPSGWSWSDTARPSRADWKPEAELFRDNVYLQANGTVSSMLFMNYRERGVWEAHQALQQYMTYQEFRPKTEPWTADGNSIESRELGIEGIAFNTIFYAYCGGLAFSTWDDGGATRPLPNKPAQLWGRDDYYGRYQTRLAAFREAFKELQGANPDNFKYVIFYYPFKGQNNNEMVSAALYNGTRLYFCCVDPNREHNESWNFTLTAGASVFNLTAEGHEFYLGNFDVPAGLNVQDFKVEYDTIYGMHIKTNGRVGQTFNNHYE